MNIEQKVKLFLKMLKANIYLHGNHVSNFHFTQFYICVLILWIFFILTHQKLIEITSIFHSFKVLVTVLPNFQVFSYYKLETTAFQNHYHVFQNNLWHSRLYASVNSKHPHPPPQVTPGVLHSSAAPGQGFILDDLPQGRVFAFP